MNPRPHHPPTSAPELFKRAIGLRVAFCQYVSTIFILNPSLPPATKLGQGNALQASVILLTVGGMLSQHALQVVSQHTLQEGCYPSMHCRWYPSMPCRGWVAIPACLARGGLLLGGSAPGGSALVGCLLLGAWWRPPQMTRPTARGEIEGDQIQAHSQRGN